MNRPNMLNELELAKEKPDDIIYYNIFIPNNDKDGIPAVYNQITQVDILKNPSEYFLSIARFSIPGQGIPILTFKNNEYFVTLSYGGSDFTTALIYSPDIDILDDRQTIFSYQHFLDLINTALLTSFNALKLAFPLSPPTQAPYMQYNSSTLLCSLYCQQTYNATIAGAPTIEIYFNNSLYYQFDNFYVIRYGEQRVDKKDYLFVIKNMYNNAITSDINNPLITALNPYFKITQEYSTLFNFSDTQSIIFKSCLFPISPEFSQTTQNQVVAGELILTDFEPLQSLSDPSGFRGYLQYYASGAYRLINLTTISPLRNIDLQITYKDELGNQYPLIIPKNTSVTVKLVFIKKSLYKSTYSR